MERDPRELLDPILIVDIGLDAFQRCRHCRRENTTGQWEGGLTRLSPPLALFTKALGSTTLGLSPIGRAFRQIFCRFSLAPRAVTPLKVTRERAKAVTRPMAPCTGSVHLAHVAKAWTSHSSYGA